VTRPWTRLATFIHLVPWLIGIVAPLCFAWKLLTFAETNYPGDGYGLCGLGFITGAVAMGMGLVGLSGILAVLRQARMAKETGKGVGDDEVQG